MAKQHLPAAGMSVLGKESRFPYRGVENKRGNPHLIQLLMNMKVPIHIMHRNENNS